MSTAESSDIDNPYRAARPYRLILPWSICVVYLVISDHLTSFVGLCIKNFGVS